MDGTTISQGSKAGYVYVFTNPWLIDGIVKIGKAGDLEKRLEQSAGNEYVPDRYVCRYAVKSDDYDYFEGWLFQRLAGCRINPKREFFECDISDVKGLLEPSLRSGVVEAVSQAELDRINGVVQAGLQSSGNVVKKKSNNTFKDLGVPVGAELVFKNGTEVCVVFDDINQVIFNGDVDSRSISRLATTLNGYPSNGFDFFSYDGKILSQLRR
jgi:hypothetical protein